MSYRLLDDEDLEWLEEHTAPIPNNYTYVKRKVQELRAAGREPYVLWDQRNPVLQITTEEDEVVRLH